MSGHPADHQEKGLHGGNARLTRHVVDEVASLRGGALVTTGRERQVYRCR